MSEKAKKHSLITVSSIAILIVAVVCFNVISSQFFGRVDITEDNIYSLSDGTKKIIKEIDSDVTVKFYFSRSLKSLPPIIKTYASRVEEVLYEYAALSGGKITLEVFDPKPDTDDEEWARKYGITPMKIGNGEDLYFGAVFIQGKREFPMPYIDPRREEFLEYDLSEALMQAQAKKKNKIGIMSSLPVMGPPPGMPMQQEEGGSSWAFVEQLRKSFEVSSIETSTSAIDESIGVLIVIHPKKLSDSTLYAIDQFVMRGGRLIVAVDPFSRVDLAAAGQMARMSGRMPEVSSEMGKLFAAWGVDYDQQMVAGDLDGMMQVNAGGQPVAYPYFINMQGNKISRTSVITQKLNQILIAEGGSLKPAKDSKFEFEKLLTTSKDAGTANGMMAGFVSPADFAKELKQTNEELTIAAFVSGEFKSAFPTGAPPPSDSKGEAPKEHLAAVKEKNRILIIADADFLHDSNSVEKFQFGPQVILRPRNDNLNLLINGVEFLGGSENLISIRSSGKISRPFTKVQEIQKNAQIKWKQEEEKLSARLAELQKKLSELQGERASGSRFTLTSEQQSEIGKFRKEEADLMKARREVRKNLREDIEKLGNLLMVLNMGLVPMAVGVFGFSVFFRRSKRMKKRE